MKKVWLLFMITGVLIIGCQRVGDTDMNNTFDPTEVKVGDEVAGLRIKELDVGDDGPNYSVVVLFEGRTILKGKFVQYEGHDFLGNAITFEVDETSNEILPKLIYDDRNLWFAFKNREEAIQMLEKYNNEGLTIEIDDYKIHYAPTEVVNEASLVRIIEGTIKPVEPTSTIKLD